MKIKDKDDVYMKTDLVHQGIQSHLWMVVHLTIVSRTIKFKDDYVLIAKEFDKFCMKIKC